MKTGFSTLHLYTVMISRVPFIYQDAQMSKITDDMMQEIARKMADDYCERLFWDHFTIIVKMVLKREGIKIS
jgi:hypothetical protein